MNHGVVIHGRFVCSIDEFSSIGLLSQSSGAFSRVSSASNHKVGDGDLLLVDYS